MSLRVPFLFLVVWRRVRVLVGLFRCLYGLWVRVVGRVMRMMVWRVLSLRVWVMLLVVRLLVPVISLLMYVVVMSLRAVRVRVLWPFCVSVRCL